MGKIQGQPFGLVVSKTPQEALTESKKAGNEAKFYVHRSDQVLDGAISDGAGDGSNACEITINGNVIRGISRQDRISISSVAGINNEIQELYKKVSKPINYKGTVADGKALYALTGVKVGDMYNVESEITIDDNKTYPAYTNFVALLDGNGNQENMWDSLGGVKLDLKISTKYGRTPLLYDDSMGGLIMSYGFGITVNDNNMLTIDLPGENNVFSVDNEGLKLNIGDGIYIGTGNKVCVNPGNCINTDGGQVNVSCGDGLTTDNNNNKLKINLNHNGGLILDSGKLKINIGDYLSVKDNKLDIEIGSGLTYRTSGISANVEDYIEVTDINTSISTALRACYPGTFGVGLAIALNKNNTNNDVVQQLIKSDKDGLYISSSKLAQFIRNVMAAK